MLQMQNGPQYDRGLLSNRSPLLRKVCSYRANRARRYLLSFRIVPRRECPLLLPERTLLCPRLEAGSRPALWQDLLSVCRGSLPPILSVTLRPLQGLLRPCPLHAL